jgi:thiaminase/transcriptional activator TenA
LSKAPDYGRAVSLWRESAAGPWHEYTRHAFVEKLGDGSLPREAFLHYLRQDYVFLFHFARAWALAAAKAGTLGEMQACAATSHALVHVEMPLHVSICAGEGISQAELEATPEQPANLAYTRYVLESGYSGDFLDLMAALAPCVVGYAEIGHRLAAVAGETPYQSWIDTYAGEEFQEAGRTVGRLIDEALTRRLGEDWERQPRWKELSARFETATRLEVGFWEMGLNPV